MADKRYVVLEGQRYAGKHRTYVAGQDFAEAELFGNEDNILMAIGGSKDKMGESKDGKKFVAIKGKAPKIELIKPKAVKK